MRLIDADVLRQTIESKIYWGGVGLLEAIDDAPTVDAVVLPCKLGDPVFIIGGKYRGGRFDRWINTGKFRISDLEKIGKTVFLTHEEAEAALAERMKNDA
jgi:hypothetical protein